MWIADRGWSLENIGKIIFMNIENNKYEHSSSARKSDSEQELDLMSEGKWPGAVDVCNSGGWRVGSKWWHEIQSQMFLWKREDVL